jgi:hypothetical protein
VLSSNRTSSYRFKAILLGSTKHMPPDLEHLSQGLNAEHRRFTFRQFEQGNLWRVSFGLADFMTHLCTIVEHF